MKLKLSFGLFLFALLALPGSARAQSAPNINVNASASPSNVQRGRAVSVSVTMDIPSDYHVNSSRPLEKFLIPTQLTVESASGFRVTPVSYPRAILRKLKFSKSQVAVYEGRAVMRFKATAPANIDKGSKEIKLRLRYQACNDDVCFPPQTKQLNVWVNVQ